MKKYEKLLSVVLSLAALTLLPACATTPQANPQQNQVAAAFETSGTIAVAPYTRTIFSSNNF